jgi:uncharacterized RDD family membrane protein YckC
LLRELHEAKFKPRVIVALAVSTLAWLVLVPCYVVFFMILEVDKNLPGMVDSGFMWLTFLPAAIPLWFFYKWLFKAYNIIRLGRIQQMLVMALSSIWGAFPALFFGIATLFAMLGRAYNPDSGTIPVTVMFAAWVVPAGLFHMPAKEEE